MRHASSSAAKSPWNASGASDRAASTANARAVFESTSAQRGESTASLRRGASFVASVPIKSPCCFWDAAHEAMHSASASQGCVGGRAASVSAPARTSSMVRDGSRSHSASCLSSFGASAAAVASNVIHRIVTQLRRPSAVCTCTGP